MFLHTFWCKFYYFRPDNVKMYINKLNILVLPLSDNCQMYYNVLYLVILHFANILARCQNIIVFGNEFNFKFTFGINRQAIPKYGL